ncbi:hypothetical protein KTO58_18930 [Chitinophaga pendula]|uniref:hypothetical protein n=1 Tax=Chitinophaga TaxID=79328 RepID=UPI0012FDB078|nr:MULTISPECIES: hypothetical protein [Chitinophaga]UCJ05749.1 hypothetical protein KTO58_18930 [Chitinophaga pendula]
MEDGNKRTASLAVKIFAEQHGLSIVGQSQISNVALQVATNQLVDVAEISRILFKK